MYRRVIKPALFRLDAEDAHHLTVNALALMSRLPGWPAAARRLSAPADSRLMQTLWGHTYASPVGLAAGLDKNGVAVPAFSALGFGFVEVGTVTPQPQPGNDRPRLFRLPPDEALINRMGFNNAGAAALRGQLSRLGRRTVPVWVNIGKNKLTEEAAQDYVACVQELYDVADAFVVNVSSPNTPGLRALQASAELEALLRAVLNETEAQRLRTARRAPPVLVKLAPDLHPADFEASVQGALNAGVQGLIVSNTTLSRDGLTRGAVPVVGVGGIFSADDAYAKIRAGASLVEVYSSLIYEGPGLPARIHRGLGQLLERDGISHVRDAVGADA